MSDTVLRFRSKIDGWFVGVTTVFFGLCGSALLRTIRTGSISVTVVLVAALLFWSWLLVGTVYEVAGDTLVVRSGPVRRTVPLGSVRKIHSTRNSRSSPALSLDRLEIVWDRGSVLVSPKDKPGFVRVITARAPGASVEGL